MPASELTMSINRGNEKSEQRFSVPFDISEIKGRIIVPYNEIFTGCTFRKLRFNL
jgi:hypothetical protein